MEKKIDIGPKAKVSIVWNVKPTDYSREQEQSIIALMAKKYEISPNNIRVEPKFIIENTGNTDAGLNNENIENIQDPRFQQKLFQQYMSENGFDDCDFEEIKKIDSQVNQQVDFDSYEKSKRYSIKWVKWGNFLSYGPENFFDFTTLKGLVLLKGNPANESGKSTFAYDLLHYLLFGKTQTDKAATQEQLFNNYLPEATKMTVEGCITLDNQDYIIKRTLSRPALGKSKNRKVTSSVEYYKLNANGEQEALPNENLQGESSTQTSMIIKEALGNEADFDRIISANAKDLDSLISMKDTERGRLLNRWIGLSVLEDKDSIAREMYNKSIKVKRACDFYNKTDLQTAIEQYEETIKSNKEVIEKETKRGVEAKTRKEGYEKTKQTLLASLKTVDENLLKTDVTTLKNAMATLEEKGKATKAKIEALKEQLAGYPVVEVNEDEYTNLRKENDQLIRDIASYKSEINSLKRTNESLAKSEYCPTCGRKYDNVDNGPKIKANEETIKQYEAKQSNAEAKTSEIASKMANIEEMRKQVANRNRLELQLSALNTDVVSLRSDWKDKKATMDELEKNKAFIEENTRIKAEVNVQEASIRTEDEIMADARYNIGTLNTDNKNLENKILENKKLMVQIDEERKVEKNWKAYLAMIGKDGIGKIVLRNTLPIINGELNRLLSDVSDFELEITINDKNDIDFWLIRDNVRTKLSAASGLERTQSALALRVVLGKMSRLSRPPFLLLDEVLGTVAKESYDNMKKLYDKVVENYDFVLHITHLEDIADWHDKTIVVVKENNISRIQ